MFGRLLNGLKGVSVGDGTTGAGFCTAGSVVTQGLDGSMSSLMDRATRTIRLTDADRARADSRERTARGRR